MSAPRIECPCCKGTGKIKLPGGLLRTLRRVKSAKRAVTSKDLLEDGVGDTAINNRLIALADLGFIQRGGKTGKCVLWTAL